MGEQRQIELYAHFVTGVTTGKVFWPQSHIDPDVWFTILVCQDYGEHGLWKEETLHSHQLGTIS